MSLLHRKSAGKILGNPFPIEEAALMGNELIDFNVNIFNPPGKDPELVVVKRGLERAIERLNQNMGIYFAVCPFKQKWMPGGVDPCVAANFNGLPICYRFVNKHIPFAAMICLDNKRHLPVAFGARGQFLAGP